MTTCTHTRVSVLVLLGIAVINGVTIVILFIACDNFYVITVITSPR